MTYQAPAGMSVGHAHLKVSNLERSVSFYRDVLGLELMQMYGNTAAFLSAGGYHHHLGLNTWESLNGDRPPRGTTGLFHVAFLYPDRAALGKAVAQVLSSGISLTGASDHGVSEAVYFDDPDGNGIELYRDRAREEWPQDADGKLAIVSEPLDIQDLLAAS